MLVIILILIILLTPVMMLAKELIKCWWRATEEWRERRNPSKLAKKREREMAQTLLSITDKIVEKLKESENETNDDR